MTRIIFAAVGIVCFGTTAFANEPSRDWPRWRGPNADGVADGRNLPTQWSQTENIRWSVKLPGWGTSSPVVYGNRVFVTSQLNEDGKKSLLTLCFDRKDRQGTVAARFRLRRRSADPREIEPGRQHARRHRGCGVRRLRQCRHRPLLARRQADLGQPLHAPLWRSEDGLGLCRQSRWCWTTSCCSPGTTTRARVS